jgi:hypothetical protein
MEARKSEISTLPQIISFTFDFGLSIFDLSTLYNLYNNPFTLGGIKFTLFYSLLKRTITMASYLLLRSNNKSGPYTLHDLVNFGLKPYDLVWVDGKSAAWRYPSEVEELKPYAPVVEEQPYDRFYKKNTQEKKEEVVLKKPVPVQEEKSILAEKPVVPVEKPVMAEKRVVQEEEKEKVLASNELPLIEEKYEKYIPKKSVFVTLPGQKTVAVQRPVQKVQSEPQPAVAPVITVKENPAAQIKYSQPLDEIKEMYVKTLQERKDKIARKSFMLVYLKRASVIVGLVASGVLAGFIMKSNGGNKQLTQQSLQQPAKLPAALVADPVTTQESLETSAAATPGSHPATNNSIQSIPPQPERTDLSPEIVKRLEELEKKQSVKTALPRQPGATAPVEKDPVYDIQIAKPVENDPVTGERTRKVRTAADEGKAIMKPVSRSRKSGLESMVSVSSNDYKRVAFGGIRNLELTIVNESKYALDKVTVELQYLKPSEEPLKTELVQFHSVSPNGTMTMRIKDTNRGIKVSYKIIDIQPSQTETAFKN